MYARGYQQLIFLWCTTLHRKVFYFTDCSSNAQVPYDGDRIIQASAAYTCSWVITVPENYTVKLTISKNNVASVGNTNCVNDYVQVIIATYVLIAMLYKRMTVWRNMVTLLEAAVVRRKKRGTSSCIGWVFLGKYQMVMYCAITKLTFAFFKHFATI